MVNFIGNTIFWGIMGSLMVSFGVAVVFTMCVLDPVFAETVIGAWR
jgi:hypothetical protein